MCQSSFLFSFPSQNAHLPAQVRPCQTRAVPAALLALTAAGSTERGQEDPVLASAAPCCPGHGFAACVKSWLLRWLSFCLSACLLQASSTTSPSCVSPVTGVCGLAHVAGEPQRDGDVSEVPSSEGCWQQGRGILQCSAGTAAGGGAGPPSSGSVHIQSERQKPRFLF